MKISDAVINNLKELFLHQIRKTEYKSVFWFKNLHFSDESIEFITNNIEDLYKIFALVDDNLDNDCDTLDIYLCLVEGNTFELVAVYSPLDYYCSDRVVGCYKINNNIEDLVDKLNLTKIW